MKVVLLIGFGLSLIAAASCRSTTNDDKWSVLATDIEVYHSSTANPQTGNIAHTEYCAAKLSNGPSLLHIIYRPADFPDRNPGFSRGDILKIMGMEKSEDFGAVEGLDFWIEDVKIIKY